MLDRFSGSMITAAVAAAAASAVISMPIARTQAQSVAASAPTPVLKTPWGEPDLQGIWMEETDTPLQRPARYGNQEFFTAAQRAELDVERAGLAGKDNRAERGTELDVGGSYNQLFVPRKHTGTRTSMIVDPVKAVPSVIESPKATMARVGVAVSTMTPVRKKRLAKRSATGNSALPV